jgi:hypothetical protein
MRSVAARVSGAAFCREAPIEMSTGPVSQNAPSAATAGARKELLRLFRERPISDEELLVNLCLYMRSGALARILFLDELYRKIVKLPGVICEFGIWWGQSLVVFENLRAVHEPYHARRIVGFDTFAGYSGIGEADKRSSTIAEGVYGVPAGYEAYLDALLSCHEAENVMSHVRKHELVKGDATEAAGRWFERNPEALVALAFFDMALYEPTKAALEAIRPRLVKGSVVAFDELGNKDYPGETRAALEILGTEGFKIRRSRFLPDRSYFVKV